MPATYLRAPPVEHSMCSVPFSPLNTFFLFLFSLKKHPLLTIFCGISFRKYKFRRFTEFSFGTVPIRIKAPQALRHQSLLYIFSVSLDKIVCRVALNVLAGWMTALASLKGAAML